MESVSDNTTDNLGLNMDFEKPVCMVPGNYEWIASPAGGVSRVPLERVSAESGHKTSFVRFKPDSHFPYQFLLHHLHRKPFMTTPVIFLQMNDFPSLDRYSLEIDL